MLLLRTAFRNIIGGGKKTWLNVFVLSFTMVIMIGFNGLIDGWVEETRTETRKWETGAGQFWHKEYSRYDVFSLQDAHGQPDEALTPYIQNKSLTPVLIIQATLYPQGRMQSILLKGIDPDQTVLDLPSQWLKKSNGADISAIIGKRMAETANLKEGDKVMMRWRDKNDAFDAREIYIAGIYSNKLPAADNGQIWISMDDLYEITGLRNEATLLVSSDDFNLRKDAGDWVYRDLDYLMADVDAMESSAKVEIFIAFLLLMSISLLAVFDTQTLSIFRRQKEIGTYVALGMTPKKVMALFTLEGTAYSLLAVVAGLVWGTPLLYLFSVYGFQMPEAYEDIMGTTALYPVYHFSGIAISLTAIILLSALISYLPARKIAKQNVVYALKGKIQ